MRKSRPLLTEQHSLDAAGSESYSSNSSYSDTCSEGSDLVNWEEYVAADGTLFYAEYKPHKTIITTTTTQLGTNNAADKRIEFARNSPLRLNKKLSRRQQQQQNVKKSMTEDAQFSIVPEQQRKFSNINVHSLQHSKQLDMIITTADRYRYGRRSTAVESILGFRVLPFPDQPECLMVHSFVHDALQQQLDNQLVQCGDWFKSLNDIEIRASNVDDLLMQFVEPIKVCLKFQAPQISTYNNSDLSAFNAHATADWQKIKKFSDFVQLFSQQDTTAAIETLPPFALLILPPECYQNDEHKDSLFYFPAHNANMANFLYKTRGSFLTLNAVLSEELQTRPQIAKLLVEQQLYYVCFRTLNGFLVLYAYAAQYLTLAEAQLRANELIAYMRFTLPQLSLCSFASTQADGTISLRRTLLELCLMQRIRLLTVHHRGECQFEQLLKESRHMPLPKEAQLRIFDALSEMEAMDYRNWNDEPLNTHREFFIHGSVLYYEHLLLATHLPVELRHSVEGYLRCRGIFEFVAAQHIKELYVWEEIVLPNTAGRYFLTICSRNRLILAVVLKIFDAPDLSVNTVIPPSLFYIEEIQETLDHLIQCGIESLAMFWSISNKRPEVLDKLQLTERSEKETRKLETFIKQKLSVNVTNAVQVTGNNSSTASVLSGGSSSMPTRSISYDEETHLCSSLGGGSSIHSLTTSEDDANKKRLVTNEDSDSGSDWENFAEQHPLRYGLDAETPIPIAESLWKEINNVVPVKISAGWKNAVFYYVYVDSVNGSVFCPLKANSESFPFLREMRRACHMIHGVLQQTKHYRRLLAQEANKVNAAANNAAGSNSSNQSATNGANNSTNASSKGMFAIKEHGLTIEVCENLAEQQQPQLLPDKPEKELLRARFVVIGRLFHAPTKEIYVCHRPDIPQNMVEMAFRLSFFAFG